jgi:hypothetical protein
MQARVVVSGLCRGFDLRGLAQAKPKFGAAKECFFPLPGGCC